MTIKEYLDKQLKIDIADKRSFSGIFVCIDRDMNIVLADPTEEKNISEHFIGWTMIPRYSIQGIYAQ